VVVEQEDRVHQRHHRCRVVHLPCRPSPHDIGLQRTARSGWTCSLVLAAPTHTLVVCSTNAQTCCRYSNTQIPSCYTNTQKCSIHTDTHTCFNRPTMRPPGLLMIEVGKARVVSMSCPLVMTKECRDNWSRRREVVDVDV